MLAYIIRRILYAFPVLLGINLITFILFFAINSPDDMARAQLGQKYVTPQMMTTWKITHNYNWPLFYNAQEKGLAHITDTLFYQKSLTLFAFNFGLSDQGRSINADIKQRMWPSFALASGMLVLGVAVNIIFALLLVFFRRTAFELPGTLSCIVLMSISGLFYIIAGQYIFAKLLLLFPISGYQSGLAAWHFLLLPMLIGVVSGIGSGARWYKTIFLEEVEKEYARTARAKGLSELATLFKHVLKNGMLPILTGIVVVIPSLFLGSLLLESFFGIPGLGSYTIDAIKNQDFSIVRATVFLGTVLYIVGLMMTDIAYTLVDPRVHLE